MGTLWSPRWQEIAEVKFDPAKMRQDMNLMKHIQTGHGYLPTWRRKCEAEGVPLAWMEDSHFGEPQGDHIDGVFVTAHSCRMAYYAHRIFSRWSGGREKRSVVEVGPGFGSMARLLAKLFGDFIAVYLLVDSPDIWIVSQCYLTGSGASQRAQYRWVRPDTEWSVCDLVINTNSLGEMDQSEVANYFEMIQSYLIEGGAFYSHNRIKRETDFANYPYDGDWEHHVARDGIFVEALSIRKEGANAPHPITLI